MKASTQPVRMPMDDAIRRFCVTARICRPKAERFRSSSKVTKTIIEKTMIHIRFQVIDSPPSSKAPDIQLGLRTSRLVGPKIVRTACCRMRDTPHVASSVSSGRP
ncbi:hypothetical protein AJ87_22220 [Rhizobium yanglingense]|nr:hypothetical protein AJ87_22220 [Rhizobium yanglingense]